ncbi:adenosine kinase [Candidatus Woesearchaeota archaeon B3_Woes]|nr:MAG: adenosine kinase [Candidatus Woesearchaeota archaeon B3_Woes]
MKKYDVFGIGNALMDTLVEVDDRDINDLELKKGTMHLVEEAHVSFVTNFLKNKNSKKQAGGSVSNTIAGVANLGGKSFFTGKVGRDKLGFDYEMIMMRQGVHCDLKKDDVGTGNVISLITKDSERTFITYLGSAVKFSKKDINKKELLKSKILHLEGYMLENLNLRKASLHAMKIAKRNGVIISIDLSDSALIERNLEDFKKIVKKYCDILFLNEDEARSFTGKNEEEALLDVSRMVKLAIIKLGECGSIIKTKNKVLRFKAYKPKKVVDTTGAGDIYAAGILYSISNKLSLEDAGKIASYAATKVIEQTGARLDYELKEHLNF